MISEETTNLRVLNARATFTLSETDQGFQGRE